MSDDHFSPHGGYSTRPLAPNRRVEGWTRAVSDRFVESSFSVREPEQFVASMRHHDLGMLALTHFDSTGHGVKRVLHSQRQATTSSEEFYIVCVQLAGSSKVEQDGRIAELQPGSLAMVDTRRAYELQMACDYRQSVLRVPAAAFDRRAPHAAARVAMSVDPASAAALGLCQTLAAIGAASAAPCGGAALDLGEAVLALLSAGLRRPDDDTAPDAVRRLQRVKALLRLHLHEPHLGVEGMAKLLALSPSYLHLLFRGEGSSPMRWLWTERLQRARELLCDARQARRSITEIAFELGFSDAAHFSRSFRSRFGVTPSMCRRDAVSLCVRS